jgi:hypothetical protein
MESKPKSGPDVPGDERREFLTRRLLPMATVVGALGVVGAAVLRPAGTPPPSRPYAPQEPAPALPAPAPTGQLPESYAKTALLVGPGMPGGFTRSLTGLALGPGGEVYALGDGEGRVFGSGGRFVRSFSVQKGATCVGVAKDGRVAVGSPGRVDLFDASGTAEGGFACGSTEKPAIVTAVRLHDDSVLVADAAARVIRRYDRRGRELGLIGTANKTGGFMLPNRSLDFDLDSDGVIHATDSGRHRVSSWTLDGALLTSFGKFGMARAEDFVGCCNPVNLAVAPDGSIVTAEKAISRLKVFGKDRTLLAVIGPEHFDPALVHIHVAVDSTGRILAADPVRRTIALFERS